MLLRALAAADAVRSDTRGDSVEVTETVKNVFETIAMAKVSTSAIDARALRIIEDIDSISMNRSRLVSDAKAQALRLARSGYAAPVMRTNIPAPASTSARACSRIAFAAAFSATMRQAASFFSTSEFSTSPVPTLLSMNSPLCNRLTVAGS